MCNNNHAIVVTKDGKVYSWGSNDFGQLGLSHFENKNTRNFFRRFLQVY